MFDISLHNSRDLLRQLYRDFSANQGVLLATALAYHILLSVIPLLILTLIILANIIDEPTLIDLIQIQLAETIPASLDTVLQQVDAAYQSRTVFGIMGIISLFVFSSLIFRTLQRIMKVFFDPYTDVTRTRLSRLIIPYLFVLLFLLLSFLLFLLNGYLAGLKPEQMGALAQHIDISNVLRELTQFLIIVTNFVLLVLFYKVLPKVKIKWKHAIVAAFLVGVTWMGIKEILGIFYARFSSISMIYGALSSFFILLLSLELFSVLLLVGAQFIATYRGYKKRQLL